MLNPSNFSGGAALGIYEPDLANPLNAVQLEEYAEWWRIMSARWKIVAWWNWAWRTSACASLNSH
ncbi:MAG: hypothetical protein GY820_28140 [Gammaproteobacteria bacterium]|nr:hypothetical protein [Gammaproteobacteria bacterium]